MMAMPAMPSPQTPSAHFQPMAVPKPMTQDEAVPLVPFVPGGKAGGGTHVGAPYRSPFALTGPMPEFLPFGPRNGGAPVGAVPVPPGLTVPKYPAPPPARAALPPAPPPMAKAPPSAPAHQPPSIGATQRKWAGKVKTSIGKKLAPKAGVTQSRIQELTRQNQEAEATIAEQRDTLQRTRSDYETLRQQAENCFGLAQEHAQKSVMLGDEANRRISQAETLNRMTQDKLTDAEQQMKDIAAREQQAVAELDQAVAECVQLRAATNRDKVRYEQTQTIAQLWESRAAALADEFTKLESTTETLRTLLSDQTKRADILSSDVSALVDNRNSWKQETETCEQHMTSMVGQLVANGEAYRTEASELEAFRASANTELSEFRQDQDEYLALWYQSEDHAATCTEEAVVEMRNDLSTELHAELMEEVKPRFAAMTQEIEMLRAYKERTEKDLEKYKNKIETMEQYIEELEFLRDNPLSSEPETPAGGAPVGPTSKFGAELDALMMPALTPLPPGNPHPECVSFQVNGVVVVQGDDGAYYAEDAMKQDGYIHTLSECYNAYREPLEPVHEPQLYQVTPFRNTATGDLFAIALSDEGNRLLPVLSLTTNDEEEEEEAAGEESFPPGARSAGCAPVGSEPMSKDDFVAAQIQASQTSKQSTWKELKNIPTRFPKWTEISKWESEMIEALCGNSWVDDNAEAAWFMKIKTIKLNNPDDLVPPELGSSDGSRFVWIDRQLPSIISKKFPKDLKARNAIRKTKMLKKGINNGIMTGRQVIWSIYDHYSRLDCTVTMYGYQDLSKIQWMGDATPQMRYFLEIFDEICDNFENDEWKNNIKGREKIMFDSMAKSDRMAHVYKNYWTAEEGSSMKSLDYLRRGIEKEIEHDEQKRVEQLRTNQIEEYTTSKKPKKNNDGRKTRGNKNNHDDGEDAAPAPSGKHGKPSPQRPPKGGKNGKPGGKPKPPKPPPKTKQPCILFHKQNNCTFGDKCHFSHAPISKADLAKLPNAPPPAKAKPPPLASPPSNPKQTEAAKETPTGKPRGKSRGRNRSNTPRPTVRYCGAFLKHGNKVSEGGCDKGKNCDKGEHLTQDQLKKKREALQKEAAKAKAKAKA